MILANDFQRQWADIGEDVVGAVERVGQSGWYVLGNEIQQFEAQLAGYWGVKHATGVANGMDAIEIGLRMLGCGPGDRVLTTPLSAFATTLAIVKLRAVPVFIDPGMGIDAVLACIKEAEPSGFARSHAVYLCCPLGWPQGWAP